MGGVTVSATGQAAVADAAAVRGRRDRSAASVLETAFTGEVAELTDANPLATVADFTATITWSDGQVSAGTVTADVWPGGFDVDGSNTYAAGRDLRASPSRINDVERGLAAGG